MGAPGGAVPGAGQGQAARALSLGCLQAGLRLVVGSGEAEAVGGDPLHRRRNGGGLTRHLIGRGGVLSTTALTASTLFQLMPDGNTPTWNRLPQRVVLTARERFVRRPGGGRAG